MNDTSGKKLLGRDSIEWKMEHQISSLIWEFEGKFWKRYAMMRMMIDRRKSTRSIHRPRGY